MKQYVKTFEGYLSEDIEILKMRDVIPLSKINKKAAQAAIGNGEKDGDCPPIAKAAVCIPAAPAPYLPVPKAPLVVQLVPLYFSVPEDPVAGGNPPKPKAAV